MEISIIIVNYNTLKLTQNCIDSIRETVQDMSYEIILVDNASKDGSKEFFENYSNINYIYSDINLGFGKANNLGANYAQGKYLFLLNSDTILLENALFNLYKFFEKYEKRLRIGVLGCWLVNNLGIPNSYGGDFPSIKNESKILIRSILRFLKFETGRNKNDKLVKIDNHSLYEVDYVIGADMLLKKSVFDLCTGFDENFFMYYEESDLQKRINEKLELKNYILKDQQIIHLEGSSAKKIGIKGFQMISSSCIYYFKKHESKLNVVLFIFIHFIHSLLFFANPKFSFTDNFKYLKSNFKTYIKKR